MSNESTQINTNPTYEADEAGWGNESGFSAFLLINLAMNDSTAPDYRDSITPSLARWALREYGPICDENQPVQHWLINLDAPVTVEVLNYAEDSVMDLYTEITQAQVDYGPLWAYSNEGLSFRSTYVALKMVQTWLVSQRNAQ